MKTTVIVDGSGLAHRLWWSNPADVPARFRAKAEAVKPGAALLVAWDCGASWRRDVYPQYKSQRPQKPAALVQALAGCRALPQMQHLEAPGYEGDDVVGTLTHEALERGEFVAIYGEDKDFAQLVGPRCLWVNGSGAVLDADAVKAKFGVKPEQMRFLLSWMGDKVDGLPGVAGYGPKKAIAKALKGEIGNEMTYELTQLVTVPRELMRRVGG